MSLVIIWYFALCGWQAGTGQTAAGPTSIVTAKQVNGIWRSGQNEFRVWALGQQKLRVEFSGTYRYKSPMGVMVNVGEGAGTAQIDGRVAVFKPKDADCKITMRFTKGKLLIEQEGGCDFGHNVTATGTYHKVSGQKPKFTDQK